MQTWMSLWPLPSTLTTPLLSWRKPLLTVWQPSRRSSWMNWRLPDKHQPAPPEARSEELSEDTNFLGLLDDDAHGSQGELGEVLSKIFDEWQWAKNKTLLSQILFPKEQRQALVDVFIKDNSPIPSSAAPVQRGRRAYIIIMIIHRIVMHY